MPMETAQKMDRYQGETVIVWNGVVLHRLVFEEVSLMANMYRNTISASIVFPYVAQEPKNFLYMYNNARPHTARRITEFLQEKSHLI